MNTIKAKFKSVCAETGKSIAIGEECYYSPEKRKVYHSESKTAKNFRINQFNQCFCMPDANW
jgi:hypothetical protein